MNGWTDQVHLKQIPKLFGKQSKDLNFKKFRCVMGDKRKLISFMEIEALNFFYGF